MSSDPLDEIFSLGGGKKKDDQGSYPGIRPLRQLTVDPKLTTTAVNVDWDEKPLCYLVQGVETEFFFIGHLAAALGRTPVTVRSWEQKGWLPLSKYRTPAPATGIPDKAVAGRRLYTRAMVEIVIAAATQCRVLHDNARNADWPSFTSAVLAGWKKLS